MATMHKGDLESVLASMLADTAREHGDLELRITVKAGYIVNILTGPMTREEMQVIHRDDSLMYDYPYTHRIVNKTVKVPGPAFVAFKPPKALAKRSKKK